MSISTTRILNYESKTHAIDSQISGSFSVRIREVERTLVRSPSGRHENLLKQKTLGSSAAIKFEIPPCFLAGEEICSGYVATALSKTMIDRWIQRRILSKICKDAVSMSSHLHGEKGFLVEAEVEAVQETSLDKFLDINDYDSKGRRVPTEKDCTICLEELYSSRGGKMIMKLRNCEHSFHRKCLLPWLRRKYSCPTCRDDIQNPRPKKDIPRMIKYPKNENGKRQKRNKNTSAKPAQLRN